MACSFILINLCYRKKTPIINPFARIVFENGLIINFFNEGIIIKMSFGLLGLNDSIRREQIFMKKELEYFKAYQIYKSGNKETICFYSSIPEDIAVINQTLIIYETINYASDNDKIKGQYLLWHIYYWQMIQSPKIIKETTEIIIQSAIKQMVREYIFTPDYVISPTKLLLLYGLWDSKKSMDDTPPCNKFLITLCQFVCEYKLENITELDTSKNILYEEVELAYQLILLTECIRTSIPRALLEQIIINNKEYKFNELTMYDIYNIISKFCRNNPNPLFLLN
jgi:hypothetical protein